MKCPFCWLEAEERHHTRGEGESVTEVYYVVMAEAEAEGRPCTKPDAEWRTQEQS